jgi:hypothetical protein
MVVGGLPEFGRRQSLRQHRKAQEKTRAACKAEIDARLAAILSN